MNVFLPGTQVPGQHRGSERGIAFVVTLFAATALGAMVYATSILTSTELGDSRRGIMQLKAFAIADAGVERTVAFTRAVVKKTAPLDPLAGLKTLFDDGEGGFKTITAFDAEPVKDGASTLGEFVVTMDTVERLDGMDITITSTGYFPRAPKNLPSGSRVFSQSIRTTIRVEQEPSEIFNYAYFVNNWGWFYGDTIECNGSLRSNGQFDAGGYAPLITGQTAYDGLAWVGGNANLQGYQDSNGDGLQDGLDGGVFSGWDVVGAQNVRGEGGKSKNQHDFQDQVTMPNLTDLSVYEKSAKAQGSSIKVDGVEISDAVLGDESGEQQNLYLVGTAAKPIVITGTVVVRGNVVISGVVKGQGSIYAGGNVYIPNNLSYANPPASARPASQTKAVQEAWITANKDKDMLGLFARENIVLGDLTKSDWRYYVDWWLDNDDNKSEEDAGEDGIPNTRDGRDGIASTADDDLLDGDGEATTEKYTLKDQLLGIIPPGKSIDDPIPGTGEDIDGDGVQDGRIGLSELDLPSALTSANWGGNLPAGGVAQYSDIASLAMTKVEAVMYTNHALAWVTLPWTSPVEINGAIIARNESIIYGAPKISMNYDCRLLGGNKSYAEGIFDLPKTMAPIRTLSWQVLAHNADKAQP